jgi:PTS system nitrogen regulatory IIA component
LPFDLDNAPIDSPSSETFDSLVAVMKRGNVFHRVTGTNKNEALRSAINCIGLFPTNAQDELFDKLLAREHLASTGIGNGIAIPHPREPISQAPASPVITTCFLEEPIPFNAIDDQPVSILFLLISPTVKHHLHLLSRLSYCIRDKAFVGFLHTHPEAEDLFSHIEAFETQLDEH